jgi:hypothetical protein
MTQPPDDAALVARLREEAQQLQFVAWSRTDGGQDCSISAALAEEAATALEAKDRRIAELEAGWQGMDSAPMNGTPLLLFARCVTAIAPGILVGWYIPDRWIELSFTGPVGIVPYAWQPLPGFPARAALEPSDKGVG